MKLYALACCILALSAQAVRADAFLPGPDKYENSFIHTAAFTPVGEHTTEWSEKSRPDVRRYKTAAEYAIASSRARYADLDSLKKAVTQDCVVLYDKQHDAACKCAVARADWKSYAAVELAMLQEQDASLELNRLWNETRRMETQCKLPAMPRYAFYSGLNLNQYGVASPCRTIVLSAASSPCPDLNLIHYNGRQFFQTASHTANQSKSGRLTAIAFLVVD